MIENVIELFNQLEKYKVTFTPAIKIKMTPHAQPTWIDDMYQVSSAYMVTVSTNDDNIKLNIKSLTPEQLQSLNTRLYSLVR